MAIQELSREEVSMVSGGADLVSGLLGGVLTVVGKLLTTPLVTNLLSTLTKLTGGLLGALKR
ncbi:hypothetical protein C3942_20735 [Solimonas fluminis]|uniref:Uncharacterized protein n=1 Tax=Solimonas fluminis TaxID=2086571 RepID=A0A2S5TAD5_9GAMM|nr:hypothetical protein [Solimonas fluminis]PPE71970.1 hypothetical protein C3942_20735 [Solimonas fluminis]